MKVFLNYYDGDYRVEEFYLLEFVLGEPFYDGKPCFIGDKFEIPCKDIIFKGSVHPIHTVLGYGTDGNWYFKGFEDRPIGGMLCRKLERG